MIRPVTLNDANAITLIYNHYITHSVITFEEQPITADEIKRRIKTVLIDRLPWLVIEENKEIIGYAYAATWKARSAYRFSVETTTYLAENAQGKGFGSQLALALIKALKKCPVNAVIAGITLPNPASIALHEKLGMSKVAHFNNVGFKHGQWHDVGYWQMNLPCQPADLKT